MFKFPWSGPLIIIFALFAANLRAETVKDIKVADAFGVDQMLVPQMNGKNILVLGFYQCHHLCDNIVKSLSSKLQNLNQSIPVNFVSVDENEGPRDALRMHKRVKDPKNLWKFFVSDKDSIAELTKSMNFTFKRDPVSGFITHEVGVFLMNGSTVVKKIAPLDLKKSDFDESVPQSKYFDFKQFCSAFDPHRSKYGSVIMTSLSVICAVFAVGMLIFYKYLRRGQA